MLLEAAPPQHVDCGMSAKSSIQDELKQRRPFASTAAEAAAALLRTGDMARRYYEQQVEPYGITFHQYNVLRILRGAGPAGLPTLEIADRMIEQTPGITRLIDRLVAKKLVRRRRVPADRRKVLCTVTPAGLALLEELDAPLDAWDEELMAGISEPDLDRLIRVLDRIRRTLGAAVGPVEPEAPPG